MEKFFNLSFLKYPISLIINMILVGFYLYIFPAKASTKVRENEFAAINLDIPSADKKIEEKNSFNQEQSGENGDFSAAEIAQNERIALDNSRSDFIIRTSKKPTRPDNLTKKIAYRQSITKHKSQSDITPSNREYRSVTKSNNFSENKSPYQENHDKTVEKLTERIKELEERKRQSVNNNVSGTASNYEKNSPQNDVKNDGFSFKDKDLIPKGGMDSELSNPLLANVANHFYSNNRVKESGNTPGFIPNITKANNQKMPTVLLKGKLLESKTVRNNATIKIMLTESKVIGNIHFESGDILGAKTSIHGDRLMLSVDGYLKNDLYLPLSAQVMDIDGILGLKVSIDADNEMQKNAWGQNVGSTLGSVNPLLVYNPQGNLGQTVGNQVVGSLVNQSLNGANQYVNAKIRDVKVSIKTGQQLFLLIKN